MENQQARLAVVEVVESNDGTPNLVLLTDGQPYPAGPGAALAVGDEAMVLNGAAVAFTQTPETLNDILAAVVASAPPPEENTKPAPDEEVEAAFASAPPPAQPVLDPGEAAQFRLQPLYRLEDAIALPEVLPQEGEGQYLNLNSDDDREIMSFKDADSRTMRVVLVAGGLAKMAA